MPRIALLTTSFPHSEGDLSGHFVLAHARSLVRLGFEVHVVTPGAPRVGPSAQRRAPPIGGEARTLRALSAKDLAFSAQPSRSWCPDDPGLVVHRVRGGSLFAFPGAVHNLRENPAKIVGAPSFVASAALKLRRLAPFERIVSHWIVPSAFPIALFAKGPLHVVAHGADVRFLVAAPAPFRTFVLSALLRRGARFQFVATYLLETLAAALPRALAEQLRARSFVEPAPLEVPDVRAQAASLRGGLSLRAGDRLAVCVGRFVAEKRFDLAVRASLLAGDTLRLVLVGDGPEVAHLRRLAAAHPHQITFAGRVHRSTALAWIAAADVLVHPSTEEGAPSVVREARLLGTPVIACDAGDVGLWAESDRGIVVVAPSEGAFREALRVVFEPLPRNKPPE